MAKGASIDPFRSLYLRVGQLCDFAQVITSPRGYPAKKELLRNSASEHHAHTIQHLKNQSVKGSKDEHSGRSTGLGGLI